MSSTTSQSKAVASQVHDVIDAILYQRNLEVTGCLAFDRAEQKLVSIGKTALPVLEEALLHLLNQCTDADSLSKDMPGIVVAVGGHLLIASACNSNDIGIFILALPLAPLRLYVRQFAWRFAKDGTRRRFGVEPCVALVEAIKHLSCRHSDSELSELATRSLKHVL